MQNSGVLQSGTANDKQRANFVLAHRSIFQVRPDILFSWLRLLKLVNPFYSDVEILNCTNETCSNLYQYCITLVCDYIKFYPTARMA